MLIFLLGVALATALLALDTMRKLRSNLKPVPVPVRNK
jgi:hypothetical protein